MEQDENTEKCPECDAPVSKNQLDAYSSDEHPDGMCGGCWHQKQDKEKENQKYDNKVRHGTQDWKDKVAS